MDKKANNIKLPEKWVWTTLGEVGIIVSGGTPSTDEPKYWNGGIEWITPSDLSSYKEKYIAQGRRDISQSGLAESSAVLLPKNSLLFSSRAPIGYVVISKQNLATNQGFKNIIPLPSTYIDYLYYYLKYAKHEAIKRASGTTFLELSAVNFSRIPLPLPPIQEQKRIVNKIEELFSEIDTNMLTLEKSKKQLLVYREIVLKEAFEGKLTENWRKENVTYKADNYLTVLKDISTEKYNDQLKTYNAEQALWLKNKDKKKPVKPKKPGPLLPLENKIIKTLPNIPNSWKWIRNSDLLYYVTSGSRDWKKYYSKEGAYFIRTQDIKTNQLDLSNSAYVKLPENVEGKRSLVEQGDLLVTITGANVGKIAHVRSQIPEAYVSQSVALIKPINILSSNYLHLYFQSKIFGAKFLNDLVYGVGRPVLSLENIKEIPIPICSLEEQKLIVNIIEETFSLIEKLEEAINNSIIKIEQLKQSIYKNAFTGKLVAQHEDDINAIDILNRIIIEKKEYQKEQLKAKNVRKPVKEKSLSLIIGENFGKNNFTIDSLKNKAKFSDKKFKNDFFTLLEKGIITSSFDKKTETILYKSTL